MGVMYWYYTTRENGERLGSKGMIGHVICGISVISAAFLAGDLNTQLEIVGGEKFMGQNSVVIELVFFALLASAGLGWLYRESIQMIRRIRGNIGEHDGLGWKWTTISMACGTVGAACFATAFLVPSAATVCLVIGAVLALGPFLI